MSTNQRYLLDVNILIAILDEYHSHHHAAREWFDTPGLAWALCPFTEAGFLRYMTMPKPGTNVPRMSMEKAVALLENLTHEPGHRYQLVPADWQTLTRPFAKHILGHKQVTDAWLLGTALQAGLTLVTFDRAMLHLAGEFRGSVLLLEV